MIRMIKLVLCFGTGLLFCVESFAADATREIAWTTATVKPAPNQPHGYLQFQNYCSVCHGKGSDKPGTLALMVKYGDELPPLLEERRDLESKYIRYIVRQGVNVMPPFRKTELSDTDLDAIIAYLTRKRL